MAELDLTNTFNDCVDRLAQGQSVDECLRRYPHYASTLRPMLEAGLLVHRMRIQPADLLVAQTRVRRRFEDALRAPSTRNVSIVRRFVYAVAAILIIGFISVGSLSIVSQSSLPGDPMYGIKTFSEGLQKTFLDSDTLEAGFKQRRIQEIQQLLALGRSEAVTFSGVVTAQNNTNWVVASLPITVQQNVSNATIAHIGDEVNVTALTTELHTLMAITIQIIKPTALPLPTATTNTVVLTVAIPTLSLTPSLSPTRTPTSTPQPSATKVIPTATLITPTPVPATPATPQITILTPTECIPTRPNGWVSYPIQSGDTLSALAASAGITLAELMTINCLSDPRRIIVGENIYLPRIPAIAPTASLSGNQGSGSNTSGGDNSGSPNPTDDHGGESDSGHGGSGSGGDGSDDGSGHN